MSDGVGPMSNAPTTLPGWQARDYLFTSTDDADEGTYGFDVGAPDGAGLGSVRESTPEAASAAACTLAGAHAGPE